MDYFIDNIAGSATIQIILILMSPDGTCGSTVVLMKIVESVLL